MNTKMKGRKAAAWLASLIGMLLFGTMFVNTFSASSAAAQDAVIAPAAVQIGTVGTRYTQADIRFNPDDKSYYVNFEGYYVNLAKETKDIVATYTLIDVAGTPYASESKAYQVLTTEDHFLRWTPKFDLPAVAQFNYWVTVKVCEEGTTTCNMSGRALFDSRLGNGEYGTLNAVIELRPAPANACQVQARYKVHLDPATKLYDGMGVLVHEEVLAEVDADGWTKWSKEVTLKEGTFKLTATSPDPNIASIEEMFMVSTPECPPETSTPTMTPTVTPSITPSKTPETPTVTPEKTPETPTTVPQGCDALLLTNQTLVPPYRVTAKLSGHGIDMQSGQITISDGRVIPVHNGMELTLEFSAVGTYGLTGVLFDGGVPFGGSQCNGTVTFTEEQKTPTPESKLFLPGVSRGEEMTSTPTPTPTPTNLEGCVIGLDPIIKGPYSLNPAVKTGWMDLDWDSNQGHVGSEEAISSWLPGLVDPSGRVRYEVMLAARGSQTLVIGMKKDGVELTPTNDFTDEADNQLHSRLRPFKNGSEHGSTQFNSWEVQYYYGPGWSGKLVTWCESIQGQDMKPASVTSANLKAEGYTEVLPAVQDAAAAAAMVSSQQ